MEDRMKRGVVLLGVVLLAACEQDPAPSARADAVTASKTTTASVIAPGPTTIAVPAKTPAVAPVVSASASASAAVAGSAAASGSTAAATAPASLLATFVTKAAKVKVRRLDEGGGGPAVLIDEAEKIAELLKSLGASQTPKDACPRCIPSVQLSFEDAFGTRLGSVGLFCSDQREQPAMAALRDALGDHCQTLTVADPEALRRFLDAAAPLAADAG
jgi:hypothetical protein